MLARDKTGLNRDTVRITPNRAPRGQSVMDDQHRAVNIDPRPQVRPGRPRPPIMNFTREIHNVINFSSQTLF